MSHTVAFASLTNRLRAEAAAVWRDAYPAHQCYADECERLLSFLVAHSELSRFWPRLSSRPQQRDEALNEIRIAYFLESMGYPVISFEPTDALPYNVEFAVALSQVSRALVEVKSPGWEAELSKQERQRGRIRKGKHIGIEARWADPVNVIRRSVAKAAPKFSGREPSLAVLSDDCFVNLGSWGWGPATMALMQRSLAYGPGLFHLPEYSKIGGVCLFWISRADASGVSYTSLCVPNPNSLPSAALPPEFVAGISGVPVEPVAALIEQGSI